MCTLYSRHARQMVYWDNGENENSFMRDLASMTTSGGRSVPIMVSPGNGDYGGGKYARFKAQFAMPGWQDRESLYHSFNIGRAHIVGINTEDIEHSSATTMLAWLDADLRAANEPDARTLRPWLVVHFHRPAYSTGNTDDAPYKVFEPLMYKYGVDIVFAGHVHNQERTFPVFNKTVMPGPDPSRPYHDARAPVYVVSGNPGNAEETNVWNRGFDAWTAWRSYHFGYTHLEVHNATAITVDFLSTNMGGATTDSFAITKSRTCAFGSVCNPKALPTHDRRDAAHDRRDATHDRRDAARENRPQRISSVATAANLARTWARANAVAGGVPGEQIEVGGGEWR